MNGVRPDLFQAGHTGRAGGAPPKIPTPTTRHRRKKIQSIQARLAFAAEPPPRPGEGVSRPKYVRSAPAKPNRTRGGAGTTEFLCNPFQTKKTQKNTARLPTFFWREDIKPNPTPRHTYILLASPVANTTPRDRRSVRSVPAARPPPPRQPSLAPAIQRMPKPPAECAKRACAVSQRPVPWRSSGAVIGRWHRRKLSRPERDTTHKKDTSVHRPVAWCRALGAFHLGPKDAIDKGAAPPKGQKRPTQYPWRRRLGPMVPQSPSGAVRTHI